MKTIPYSVIEDVVSHCDIVEVVGDYVDLKRKRKTTFMGLCPFHNGENPLFQVDTLRQSYHCWGCGKEGDVICFIMNKEGITFNEAVIFLAARAGIIIPELAEDSSSEGKVTDWS